MYTLMSMLAPIDELPLAVDRFLDGRVWPLEDELEVRLMIDLIRHVTGAAPPQCTHAGILQQPLCFTKDPPVVLLGFAHMCIVHSEAAPQADCICVPTCKTTLLIQKL